MKKSLFYALIVALIPVTYMVAMEQSKSQISKNNSDWEKTLTIFKDQEQDKVEQLKRDLVMDLSNKCEVLGIAENKKMGAIILDTNNQMSIGPMMFQRETIIDVKSRFLGEQVSWDEATKIAMSEEAYDLAEYLIFEKGELHRWTNCANRLKLWDRVEVIKQLED